MSISNKKLISLIFLAVLAVTLSFVVVKQVNAASCPLGDGLYCGSSSIYGQNTNNLYKCLKGVYSLSQLCSYGCQGMPAGTDDKCKPAPAPVPTVNVSVSASSITLGNSFNFTWSSTNATYCTGYHGGTYSTGGTIPITPSSIGTYTAGMSCTGSGGTSSMATKNVTVSAAPVASCPLGDGLYCGSSSLGQNTGYLYNCLKGVYSLSQSCSYGCQSMPAGTNDKCKPAPAPTPSCPYGDGLYCGKSSLGQNTGYLYNCLKGVYSLSQSCTYGCQSMPTGTNDKCKPAPEPTPAPGLPTPINVPGGSKGPINKLSGQPLTLFWGAANVTSWSVTGPGFSKSGGVVGAIPKYDNSVAFFPPAPPSGNHNELQHYYKIIGTGSNTEAVVLVIVRNAQCNDGLDNDGDGLIDFPADPGCSSVNDDDETDGGVPPVVPPVVPGLVVTASLSANPVSGDVPLTSILTASVGGSAVGPITYQFDCGNGTPLVSLINVNTFSCVYAVAGNYTAIVKVDRGGAPTAQSTANVSANTPPVPIINIFEPFLGPIIVAPPAVCKISANPNPIIQPKNTTVLTWFCDKVIVGCTINDDNPKVPDFGAVPSTGSQATPPLNATTTFTFKCPKTDPASVTVRLFTSFLKEVLPR